MKVIMFLFVLSFYCLGFETFNMPKMIKGVIVHHSNSESNFELLVNDAGDCKEAEGLVTCTNPDIIITIGSKSFAIDEVRSFTGYSPGLDYYFYGDLPYSDGELSTSIRLAVITDGVGNVINIHLKFTEFNSKEDILLKEIIF